MKRLICITALLLVSLLLSACGGKLSEGMQVEITEGDTYYSNEDIQAAVDTVEKEFKKDFPGCTMTALRYTALSGKDSNTEWATQYNAEEAMVLYSDFTVDDSGRSESLNPNSIYTDWQWVLVRHAGEKWKLATWGLG